MSNKYDPRNKDASSNLILAASKKAGKKIGSVAGNALKKSLLFLLKSVGFPVFIVVLILIIILFITSYVLYGERGSMSEYNTDTIHTNDIIYTEEGNKDYLVPVASELSEDNKLVELYYKFISIQSYYKTIDGGGNILSFSKNTDDFAKYTDYYGKENMFYLNNYFLLSMDEIAHEHIFRYPEQFIKPIYADVEERKLKNLLDDEGKLEVTSTEYIDYFATENKVPGVWDYGFAPILYYKEYEKEDFVKGTYTKQDIQVGNSVITIDINEPFRVAIPESKKDIYVIENAVTQSGDITYTYEQKDMYLRNLKEGASQDESAEVTKYWYDNAYIEIETIAGTTIIEVPLYKYRTGNVVEYVPVEVSSEENLSGIQYLRDYLNNYEAYIPNGVMEDFDFENRAEDQQELITKLLVLDVFTGSTRSTTTRMGNVEAGSKVATDSYENSLQYLSYFEEYADIFGLDPYLLVAMAAQESSGQHDKYCNSSVAGIGLMQVELPKDFSTTDANGNRVYISVTREDLYDLETNIKTAAAYLKYNLDFFNGNTLMALQGYNFGSVGIKRLVEKYATENGKMYQDVRDNHEDLGWMDYREYYTNGGDKAYVENVLAYYSNSLENLTGVETVKETEEFDPVDVVDVIAEENSKKGWLEKAWENITQGFNDLIANINEIFTIEYGEESSYHENNMGELDIESVISQTLAFSNYSNYYESYDNINSLMKGDSESSNFLFLGNSNYYGGIGGGAEYIEGIAAELEGFINPMEQSYRVSSPFGPRIDPIKGTPAMHNGIDYAAPGGTPLYAVTDGIISYSGYKKSYGNIVELKSGIYHVKYAHLSKFVVREGQPVVKGQLIGYVGSTGDSTGNHLHFEVLRSGKRLDPGLYFY